MTTPKSILSILIILTLHLSISIKVESKEKIKTPHFDGCHNQPYLSNNKIVHPDVLYFPKGKDGYKYWMTYTPYPGETQENTYMIRSNDGLTWNHEGISNPMIVQSTPGTWNSQKNSSPDIIYVEDYDKWFMVWNRTSNTREIALAYSNDGKNWTEYDGNAVNGNINPIIFSGKDDQGKFWKGNNDNCPTTSIPTLLYENGKILMYYTEEARGNDPGKIGLATITWNNINNSITSVVKKTNLTIALPDNDILLSGGSHPDISFNPKDGLYYMFVVRKRKSDGTPVLTLLTSKNRKSWNDRGIIQDTGTSKNQDNQFIHRSTPLVNHKGEIVLFNNKIKLYHNTYTNGIPNIGTVLIELPFKKPWLEQSIFKAQLDWFDTTYYERVWLADVTGDKISDYVGLANNGDIWVSKGTGSSFLQSEIWCSGTIFTAANGWLSKTYHNRLWFRDVNNDGFADFIGIAGNGDVWVAKGTGTSFERSTIWQTQTVFNTPNGWFSSTYQKRIWFEDLNQDNFPDFVGIAGNGDVYVSTGTGSGFNPSSIWMVSSAFKTPNGWFDRTSHKRIWVEDVTGDQIPDLVGIDIDGNVWVSKGSGTGFTSSSIWVNGTIFKSPDFFDPNYNERIWFADVDGKGSKDIVGIGGINSGDGDIWVLQTGDSAQKWVQRPWLQGSIFKTSTDWFDRNSNPLIHLTDVTGNGLPDFTGIDFSGNIWLAKNNAQNNGRSYYQPSLLIKNIGLSRNNKFLTRSKNNNVWFSDVTGDNVHDIVAISPGQGYGSDGDILWESVLPNKVKSITPITHGMFSQNLQKIAVSFTRSMAFSPSMQHSLQFVQGNTKVLPTTVQATGSRSIEWEIGLNSSFDLNKSIENILQSSTLLDKWGRVLDGNGNDEFGGDYSRINYFGNSLLAASTKINISPTQSELAAISEFPSGFCYCPFGPADAVSDNPLFSRIIVLKNATQTLVFINLDVVGFNPGRLNELIEARTGIAKQNIITSATHAHASLRNIRLFAAPYYDNRSFPDPVNAYQNRVEEEIANNIASLMNQLQPSKIGAGKGSVQLGYNRITAGKAIDHTVGVITLQSSLDTSNTAVIVNYALHPVIISGGKITGTTDEGTVCILDPSIPKKIDADFPGYMSNLLEANNINTAMFINAGAGDVNPMDYKGNKVAGSNNVTYAKLYGDSLAKTTKNILQTISYNGPSNITIQLEQKTFDFPSISCHKCQSYPKHFQGKIIRQVQATIAIIKAGGTPILAFATIPGEPFSALQIRLRSEVSLPNTFLLGYTNGYAGYFPDNSVSSGYGVGLCNGPTFFERTHNTTSGEQIIDWAISRINALK